MSWVLRHSEAQLGDRLVLMVLADHARADGTGAYPKVETMAREARLSERQARRCLRNLETTGAIVATGKTRTGTIIYSVIMDEGGDNMSAPGGTSTTARGVRITPEPSLEPKPSVKPSGARPRDPIWEGLVTVLGTEPGTKAERGRWNGVVKELREAGATEDDIAARAREYRRRWPDVALTPNALCANWGSSEAAGIHGDDLSGVRRGCRDARRRLPGREDDGSRPRGTG